jgi:hypothetical protein
MVLGLSLIAISGLILVAADHVDAPSVQVMQQTLQICTLFKDKKLII